jgi:O-antigen/teichoic acid export membrane protein
VVYAASQWAILVVLAKLTSPETVGEFVLGFAITAPIIMFANLQLRLLQATDASGKFELQDYLGFRSLAILLAIMAIILIVRIGDYPISTAKVIVLVGIAKAVEAMSDIFHGFFQQNERMDRLAWSQAIRGLLALAGLSLAIYITRDVVVGIMAIILAWFLGLVFYDIPTAKKLKGARVEGINQPSLRPRWKLSSMRRLLLLGLPLGVVTLLRSLNTNIPRYFIEHHQGLFELGIFGGLVYVITAERRLSQALGHAVSPRLSQYFNRKESVKFRKLLVALLIITFSLGLVVVLGASIAGKQILTLIYSDVYAQYKDLFVLLAIVAIFDQTISILGYALTATRNLLIQVPLDILNLTTLIVGCIFLIPAHGLAGATWSLMISKCIGFVMSCIIVWRSLQNMQLTENPLQGFIMNAE